MTGDKPLTILIAADTYPPDVNGAAVFSYRLATAMAARGHTVHVVAAREVNGPGTVEHREEATVHRLRSHSQPTKSTLRLCLPWDAKRDISRILDEVKPDVVHVQCHYMIGQAAVNEAEARGIRTIATNHFMPENVDPFLPFPKWFKRIVARNSWRDMGKIMGRAAVVTTPTPLAARAMKSHARLGNVLPLSNGINPANYQLEPGESVPPKPWPMVLFVGRLALEKNVRVLIEALAHTTADPAPHAVIIGSGEQRGPLERRAAELGVTDRVHFTGHINDTELRTAYLQADVFCQPGTAELQSLVTLEALSASTPVLLADAMALPHLVDDGVNGYLFEPGNSRQLAEKLDAILALEADGRARMGAAGLRKAEQHSEAKSMDTFEALYRGAGAADFLTA